MESLLTMVAAWAASLLFAIGFASIGDAVMRVVNRIVSEHGAHRHDH